MLHTRHLNTTVSRRTSGRSLGDFMAKQSSVASQNCSRVGSPTTLPTGLPERRNRTTAAISWPGRLSGDRCARNSPPVTSQATRLRWAPIWRIGLRPLHGAADRRAPRTLLMLRWRVAGHVDRMREGEKYLRGFCVETWRKATSRKTKA